MPSTLRNAALLRLVGPCLLATLLACGTRNDATDTQDGGEGVRDDQETPDSDGGSIPAEPRDCQVEQATCDAFGSKRPGRLSEHTAVYDQDRLEMVVFGGTPTIPVECAFGGPTEFLSETWVYSDLCNAWTQVLGQGPPAGGRHLAVWAAGSMWLFGGRFRAADEDGLFTLFDDLHRFNVGRRSWSQVDVTGKAPSARVNGAMAYDTKRQRLWLFGGNTSDKILPYNPLDDLWFFDLKTQTWDTRRGTGTPPPRLFHNLIYDPVRDALVVFGGAGTESNAIGTSGLWAVRIDDGEWIELGQGSTKTPDTRFWSSLSYDSASDSYLLFGGHDDGALGNRNDLWRYHPEADRWEEVTTGDRFNKPANGLCDFPPDFAEIEMGMPERRNAHTFVWSEACEHAIIFAGKTDCGSTDDVWRLKGVSWEERLAATEGEACLRWRPDPEKCKDMCF